ncbi:hypothetical protein WS58_15925 [Burkholderia pseudomultivorans]|nr:hypothetical protein WS58_15925 [Burkholderia pseudomultivorans]
MQCFALWLCDVNVHEADVTLANLKAHMPSAIEGEWLWILIAVDQRSTTKTKKLLSSVKTVANLPPNEKQNLALWVQAAAKVPQHFSPMPPANLYVGPPNHWKVRSAPWQAFQTVMAAFYLEGLKEGLPYKSDGTPTADVAERVTYEKFMREFRDRHRLDPHPDAREICVLCGDVLKQPDADHWLGKSAVPLLAVSADNLLPICSDCNEPPQKGQKPVHTAGNFQDWFHPYLRHANGAVLLRYDEARLSIRVESNSAEHAEKVRNLDVLLNLSQRWTREFKAEYRRIQRDINPAERLQRRLATLSQAQVTETLINYRNNLSGLEPNYEVHSVVADVMLDPNRQQAL